MKTLCEQDTKLCLGTCETVHGYAITILLPYILYTHTHTHFSEQMCRSTLIFRQSLVKGRIIFCEILFKTMAPKNNILEYTLFKF